MKLPKKIYILFTVKTYIKQNSYEKETEFRRKREKKNPSYIPYNLKQKHQDTISINLKICELQHWLKKNKSKITLNSWTTDVIQ